jgi:tRNA pseudouridine38-40 synthase
LKTVRLFVAYDGTDFCGWQRQPQFRTVQGTLDAALKKVLKLDSISTAGAGRTDTGVHASHQVVSFVTPTIIPSSGWVPALNSVLPRDVSVWKAEITPEGFHARHSARSRSYRYQIQLSGPRDPLLARYTAWNGYPLDLEKMADVWYALKGKHDFSHFGSTGSDYVNPICTVKDVNLSVNGNLLSMEITADHFLYHMVRRLVGTTWRVGKGKLTREGFMDTWRGLAPKPSGPTAPANGLTFTKVSYEDAEIW